MKLVKTFLVTILLFLSTLCLATVGEEINELDKAIYSPIVKRFPEKENSYTSYISWKIIDKEKTEKRQFSVAEAQEFAEELELQDPFLSDESVTRIVHKSCMRMGATPGEIFYNMNMVTWDTQIARCGNMANFVLLAFAFNEMNKKSSGKPSIFRQAMRIKTTEGTGSHSFVLIEGESGTIYGVDPWSQKLVILDMFKAWPDAAALEKNKALLNEQLFRNKFYDMIYVGSDTSWYFDETSTREIFEVAATKDPYMKKIYDAFTQDKVFPLWIKSYDELFSSDNTKS